MMPLARRFLRPALAAMILLTATAPATSAAQYSPPYADIFGFAYNPDPNNLNTEESAQRFAVYMDSAGYHDFTDLNKQAVTSMGTAYAQSDAIWAFFGHGGPGSVLFCDTNGRPCDVSATTHLYADSSLGSCASPNACLSTSTGLGDIRLMLFAGCETANDGNPNGAYKGNLLDWAHSARGVDTVAGFYALVTWPMGHDYASFAGARLASGETIAVALWQASIDVKNRWFGNAWGWNSITMTGSSGDKIVPAAYGS